MNLSLITCYLEGCEILCVYRIIVKLHVNVVFLFDNLIAEDRRF